MLASFFTGCDAIPKPGGRVRQPPKRHEHQAEVVHLLKGLVKAQVFLRLTRHSTYSTVRPRGRPGNQEDFRS